MSGKKERTQRVEKRNLEGTNRGEVYLCSVVLCLPLLPCYADSLDLFTRSTNRSNLKARVLLSRVPEMLFHQNSSEAVCSLLSYIELYCTIYGVEWGHPALEGFPTQLNTHPKWTAIYSGELPGGCPRSKAKDTLVSFALAALAVIL